VADVTAASVGVSPRVVVFTPDLIVHDFVKGRDLKESDLFGE
jgi:predicted Ser/Thr protein kinase